ncbi:MAG TPA: ATP-binding protein, partial [Proteiniphilum sp.]|nr:ATP-binding protein [Proteiniphilum sp.]
MGYLKYIEESKQKVYNQTVATKIMDLVQKLRLSSNEHDQRRWIWELIQNAKDVAFENHPVSICVDLIENEDNEVIFRHNGKPFSIDNITFLIEQVSTKERNTESKEKNKPTGKFGTGFLTTHLLSETVEVDSVVKEEDLPYKKFSLLLDRSGREINDVIRSVNGSLKILRQLDDVQPYTHYKPKDFNTSFKYLLDDEGVETAKIGLEDLNLCVAYTLVFVPNIESVCINSETTFILQPEVAIEGNGVEIHTILKKITGKPSEEIHIATVSNENVTVAVEIKYEKNQIVVVEPNESLPRLFCDFPLIGTEDFIYPVVINSPFFNPTEARNGIYITDRSDNIIVENKKLLRVCLLIPNQAHNFICGLT